MKRYASPSIVVKTDDVTGPEICALIREHLDGMHANLPPESVHALGIEKLRDRSITVWSAWIDGHLAGCGALKQIGPQDGEIKSMRTRTAFLRRVVAAQLFTILAEASARGYGRLWLETGGTAQFNAARELYRRFGFVDCGPFDDYRLDPFSRYMTLALTGSTSPHD